MTTVRALLAVAALENWITLQVNVTNAFLHGGLEELVYMNLHQGYSGIGSKIQKDQSSHAGTSQLRLVCRLKKSLYGLRQAPRQWFSKISVTLLCDQFVQSKADYSLFTKYTADKITLILVCVDDLLIAGNS